MTTQKSGYGKTILSILGFLLMFGSKLMPPLFGLSGAGVQVIGTLFGGVCLLLVDTGWSTALIFVSLAMIPEIGLNSVLGSSLGSSTMFLRLVRSYLKRVWQNVSLSD